MVDFGNLLEAARRYPTLSIYMSMAHLEMCVRDVSLLPGEELSPGWT